MSLGEDVHVSATLFQGICLKLLYIAWPLSFAMLQSSSFTALNCREKIGRWSSTSLISDEAWGRRELRAIAPSSLSQTWKRALNQRMKLTDRNLIGIGDSQFSIAPKCGKIDHAQACDLDPFECIKLTKSCCSLYILCETLRLFTYYTHHIHINFEPL